MAEISAVNGQITDAVSQSGVTVLAEAPAMGLANAYQSGAHAAGLAMQNAIANQRQATTQSRSTATQAAAQVLTLGPSLSARATQETLDGYAWIQNLAALLAIARALRRESGVVAQPFNPALAGATAPPNVPGSEMPDDAVIPEPTPPAPPSVPGIDLSPLIEAVQGLTAGIASLTDTVKERPMMHDLEALEAIRRAADRVSQALEALTKELAETKAPALCESLRKGIDELRDATRKLDAQTVRPQVPVGATPGVFIVGSGNTHQAHPRIVGSTF